jgi:anti-sigma factor (TIGR02949 family)
LFVLQRLNHFLDRELDEATADLIRQHISQCEECSDEAECWIMLRQVIQRAYQPSSAPPALLERINNLIVAPAGDDFEPGNPAHAQALNQWEGESPVASPSELAEADWGERSSDRPSP